MDRKISEYIDNLTDVQLLAAVREAIRNEAVIFARVNGKSFVRSFSFLPVLERIFSQSEKNDPGGQA